jgi:hypothetical protein
MTTTTQPAGRRFQNRGRNERTKENPGSAGQVLPGPRGMFTACELFAVTTTIARNFALAVFVCNEFNEEIMNDEDDDELTDEALAKMLRRKIRELETQRAEWIRDEKRAHDDSELIAILLELRAMRGTLTDWEIDVQDKPKHEGKR